MAALGALSTAHRSVTELDGVDRITNEELLECDCDVLIPAALGDVITEQNAERVRARVLVEAANHPTTTRPTRSSTTAACASSPTSSPTPAA